MESIIFHGNVLTAEIVKETSDFTNWVFRGVEWGHKSRIMRIGVYSLRGERGIMFVPLCLLYRMACKTTKKRLPIDKLISPIPRAELRTYLREQGYSNMNKEIENNG